LQKLLEGLASKGLVMDIFIQNEYKYTVSPMVIGIFEFTMMRTRGELNFKKWAKLFNDYLNASFWEANFGTGQTTSLMRGLPYEESIEESEFTEILDYEKTTAIVESHNLFAIGICSCRHEKMHLGIKECSTPLNTCSSFGYAADFWIRNKMAKEVSKTEMLENISRSKELGLVFCGDSVKKNVTFICHCCKCCCHALGGISKYGYANTVLTSNYISTCHDDKCNGCGKCAIACPIDAIEMQPDANSMKKHKKKPVINTELCLGCGVCASKCTRSAMKLTHRKSRVLYPESIFERIILGAFDRGTLQNQIFDNPDSLSQKFLRGFFGGFLRLPPVKKKLMSENMRSRFLEFMAKGIKAKGKGWLLDM
jgi:ferredoxin